jgi:hypothetical protein
MMETTTLCFTPEAATGLLLDLTGRLERIARLKAQMATKATAFRSLPPPGIRSQKGQEAERRRLSQDLDAQLDKLNEEMNAIEALGCYPRDLDRGLVDFPASVAGVEAFLCWTKGEGEVGFWHPREVGCDARRPLPFPEFEDPAAADPVGVGTSAQPRR